MDYHQKYIKYKNKYLKLKKNMTGGKKHYKKNSGYTNRMSEKPKYIMNVSEPWFTLISLGLKKIEGRINRGRFKEMQVGDIVEWTNDNFGLRKVLTKVMRKTEYKTFEDYLKKEGLDKCLPGINNIDDGLNVYFKYYTKDDEKESGVVAIELEIIKN